MWVMHFDLLCEIVAFFWSSDMSCEEGSVSDFTPQLSEDVFMPAHPAMPPLERLLPVGPAAQRATVNERPVSVSVAVTRIGY
jgi:hypothetical protein